MDQLPVFWNLSNRACLVVGGGAVATRKVRLLLDAGAAVTVVAPEISSRLERWRRTEQLTLLRRPFSPALLDRQWLVIAATSDRAVNGLVATAAEERQVPCNVVDDPTLGNSFLPAIVDRAPVTVAISTGGRAPVLARLLKERLDRWLPQRLGRLAAFAGQRRFPVASALATSKQRQHFWRDVLDGPVADHVLAGREVEADAAFRQALAGDPVSPAGEAYLVGAGPGDGGLLTIKALELLQRADVVMHDRLVAPEIVQLARREAEIINVGKSPEGPSTPQDTINRLLVDRVRAGLRVCRLKGGDPLVFARLGEEIAALADAGLPFQVVPGISAASGAAASAAIPLTLRGAAQAVVVVTGRSEDPAGQPDWPALARPGQTLAFYMAVGQFRQIALKLTGHGLPASTPIAVIERATTAAQRTTRSQLGQLPTLAKTHGIRAPAILLIGETVRAADRWRGREQGGSPTQDTLELATAHHG
jgi:uroporphyrin-III C-methyltransferase/precorrin-2 dehydrogenase/sirohydrochlorin ferrochelatase